MSGRILSGLAVALLLGMALGVCLVLGGNAIKGRSGGARAAPKEPHRKPETMKLIIWICLGNGLAWVWCSYIMAWVGKTQIAEGLSQSAVTEIVGVVLAYAIKSVLENMSKNNRWPDKGTSGTDTGEPPAAG